MTKISAHVLKQMMTENPHLIVINVLDESEYDKAHIPGTTNIPLSRDDFVPAVKALVGNTDRRVIVYCSSSDCEASPKAARELENAGFKDVMDFEAGMAGWRNAGYELERPVTAGSA